MIKFLLIFTALVLGSCAGSKPSSVLVSTPTAKISGDTQNIDPPASRLSLSISETEWSPVVIGGSTGKMLTEALKQKDSVMILTGGKMTDDEWGDKIFHMVKAASPSTQIVARNRGVLDKILLEHGDIPYRRTWVAGGTDVFGRPYMLPEDHPLKTDWLSKKNVLKGAKAILMIDIINPESQKLKALRNQRRGNCDSLLQEIDNTSTDASQFFIPLQKKLNSLLAKEFARQLQQALPFWQKEIAQSKAVATSSSDIRCYNAYTKALKKYQPCIDNKCENAPKIYPSGGIIAMDMTPVSAIPDICPPDMGRDYIKELEEAGKRSAAAFLESIPDQWTNDIIRLKSLEDLKNIISNFCAPSYRRYSQNDLDSAKLQLKNYTANISNTIIDSSWKQASGQARIAGTGSVFILAKAVSTSDNLKIKLKNLQKKLSAMDRCKDSKRRPVQVVLVDVKTSEVYFSGIDFEEQIICEDLPPGTP